MVASHRHYDEIPGQMINKDVNHTPTPLCASASCVDALFALYFPLRTQSTSWGLLYDGPFSAVVMSTPVKITDTVVKNRKLYTQIG